MYIKPRQRKKNLSLFKHTLIIILLGILGAGCSVGNNHPDIDHEIHTVPEVLSNDDIHIDIVTDDNNGMHLVWQSKEKGVYYQRSNDSGRSWSEPVAIDPEASYRSLAEGPRIFSYKETLQIFWRHQGFNLKTSFDLGQTWINQPMKIFKGIPIAKYEITADDNVLYFAYNNHEGLFFRRSDNSGIDWTDSKKLIGFNGPPQVSAPSMAIWENTAHLFWSELDTGLMSGKLYLARSEDRGKTWSRPIEIDTDRSQLSSVYEDTYSIISPSIMTFSDNFLIFYEERGLFYKWVNANINTPTERVSLYPSRNFSFYNANDSKAYIVWSDARYQEKDWWAYIPAHQILTWDKNPFWANSDLFLALIKNHKKEETVLLTPPLSYISSNKHAISITELGDDIYIFWSGRKKVGKGVHQYGAPVEVFFVVIKSSDF